jgi:hypothetical protein
MGSPIGSGAWPPVVKKPRTKVMTGLMALAATIGVAALLVAVTVALSLFVLLGGSYTKASDLAKMPEASLVYPGSTLARTSGQDASMFYPSASLTQDYEVNASADAVAAYYHDKLIPLGWETRPAKLFAGPPSTDYQYQRGKIRISLDLWAGPSGPQSISYGLAIIQD